MKKTFNKGFTLVELLIVIIIIGILATIGFVAYSGAQNKAQHASAESTVSQVKSKLGEYYATNNAYPADQAAVVTWLNDTSSTGGNSPDLASKLGVAATTGVTYTVSGNGFTLAVDAGHAGGTAVGPVSN